VSGVGYHVPVLLKEVLELFVTGGGVYVDGTLGGGGHFRAVAERLSGAGLTNKTASSETAASLDKAVSASAERAALIGIDRDSEAIDNALRGGFDYTGVRVIVERSRFSEFDAVLRKYNIEKVQGLFVDLGVSSRQIDAPERGFTYMGDAALDMRMDGSRGVTAARLLADSGEGELAEILENYGEIRNAGRMARVIKNYMKNCEIRTSADLKACVEREYGANVKIKVFAKLFQALRIAVNDELGELRSFLDKSVKYLAEGGRLAVISYHSLEDRMVKEFLRSAEEPCVCPPRQPVCTCDKPVLFRRVTKKAVTAQAEEIARNPRSRSARLRVAERTGACL
jgi:16S rRNA (cytosine1402-N4)-methyltransferase